MALKWFRDTFLADKSFEELNVLADAVSVGCDGLTFLPYLCGSTMPKYNPNARGSFTGLTPEHTTGHFVRSIMESVACILKSNLDSLGVPVEQIRIMGGGAQSPLWSQMKSDITGQKLQTLKNKETACLGAAILAGVGASVIPLSRMPAPLFPLTRNMFLPAKITLTYMLTSANTTAF